MALVPPLISSLSKRTSVCLINDHKLRACPLEFETSAIRLDIIQRHDRIGVPLEDALPLEASSLKAGSCAGKNKLGVDMELLPEFFLPLLRKLRGTQNSHTLDLTAIQKLSHDEQRFHRLSDAYVVRNQYADWIEL
jgi:hypothetical protein